MIKSPKNKFFFFIAFMLMASVYLPLVFNNLPPLARSHHVWTIIWALSLIIFHPKIFLNKTILLLFAYGLFLIVAINSIWSNIDEWNKKLLYDELYQFSIGISVVIYFFQTRNYIGLAKLSKWIIIFLFVTAIMTIVSSAINPMFARDLGGISAVKVESEKEIILSYKRYGGGGYGTAAAFMCLFPILIYYYKNIKISLLSKKQVIIVSVIIFLALLGMQIFGNILVAIVFVIIALLGMKKIRQSILTIVLFFSIALVVPKYVYANTLFSISNYFEKESELKFKFKDLAIFIETGADINDNTTGAGGRAERYPILLETFIKSPFLGCYFSSDNSGNGYKAEGAHLYWMNKLTITGIIGLSFFLFILYYFIKKNLRYFDSTYKFFYMLASFSILSYGLIKAIAGRETWYAFFILLPGLYYLPLLKKSQYSNQNLRSKSRNLKMFSECSIRYTFF